MTIHLEWGDFGEDFLKINKLCCLKPIEFLMKFQLKMMEFGGGEEGDHFKT